MKRRTKVMTMMMAIGALAPMATSTATAGESGAAAAVRSYLSAGDQRDVAGCERLMHPEFRVVFTKGGNGDIALMSKSDYLGLMKAKKIGGAVRSVKVEWTKPAGHITHVKATLESKGARFDSLYTLVKKGGRWVILQDAVRLDVGS